MDRETEEYLAKIRKTIAESKRMVDSVKLRFVETDRMLEKSGTSRDEVMKMRFTSEQKAAVNAELERRGFSPLGDVDDLQNSAIAAAPSPVVGVVDVQEDMENRRRKFGAMMKAFRM